MHQDLACAVGNTTDQRDLLLTQAVAEHHDAIPQPLSDIAGVLNNLLDTATGHLTIIAAAVIATTAVIAAAVIATAAVIAAAVIATAAIATTASAIVSTARNGQVATSAATGKRDGGHQGSQRKKTSSLRTHNAILTDSLLGVLL
ncbi:hypothetical protein GCM10008997_01820 [Halomonas salifodinae]